MRRTRQALLTAVGLLTGGVFGIALAVVWYGWSRRRTEPTDAIILLGAKVFADGRPSRALAERARAAAEAFHEGVAPRILLSGGGGAVRTEAEVARELLQQHRVPANACVVEEASHSTADNARHSVELLRRDGLRTALVISDPFHLLRARQHFRLQGLEVATRPSRLGGLPLLELCYWVTREAFALLFQPKVLFARPPHT